MVREELEKYDGGFTDEWNDQRKKNAEVLGYELEGTSDIKETKKKDSRGTVRDYKKEYAKYGSSKKAKKYRAELNQYNRKKGTYGNGDGKDASHKGGKIVGFESQSKNRGRAEKSRLKKESINESVKVRNGETPMEGKWNIYDNSTGKAIKEVGNARAATRLMNRLMSSGQYKEVAAKWIGEPVNEANIKDIEQIVKKKQSKKIGGVLVDMQTANAIMTVWKALSTSNKKKFEKLPIKKMAKISWKLVK